MCKKRKKQRKIFGFTVLSGKMAVLAKSEKALSQYARMYERYIFFPI